MSRVVTVKPTEANLSYEGLGYIQHEVDAGDLGTVPVTVDLEEYLDEVECGVSVVDVEVDVIEVVRAFASDQAMEELIHEAIIQVCFKEVSRLVKEWKS